MQGEEVRRKVVSQQGTELLPAIRQSRHNKKHHQPLSVVAIDVIPPALFSPDSMSTWKLLSNFRNWQEGDIPSCSNSDYYIDHHSSTTDHDRPMQQATDALQGRLQGIRIQRRKCNIARSTRRLEPQP